MFIQIPFVHREKQKEPSGKKKSPKDRLSSILIMVGTSGPHVIFPEDNGMGKMNCSMYKTMTFWRWVFTDFAEGICSSKF